MQSIQTIKRRLRSVKNIGQITKAMELVAATKMRRSQEAALASRPYAYAALDFLAHLSRVPIGFTPPLLERRPVEKTAIVLVASDKGLTGSFNSTVFRAFERMGVQPAGTAYIAVGQKAVSYIERRAGTAIKQFIKFGDSTTIEETLPLAKCLIDGYLARTWDRVLVVSTNFQSALRQDVVVRELFPVTFESLQKTAEEITPQRGRYAEDGVSPRPRQMEQEYIIEPSPEQALTALIPHLVVMQVYHIILEANASEHAARRMAMKSASDNASEIVEDLTLEYNKSRQAGITKELIEITSGAESLA